VEMEITNLVVARYADGRVTKGTTRDFSPLRPSFHVEVESGGGVVEIRTRQLKALFFVKSFAGSADRADVRGFLDGPQENSQGRKIAVRFRDGEFMCGYATSWTPDREGFFLFPADTGSNNDRVYVVSSATAEVKAGPAAEALAQRVLAAATATGGTPASRPGKAQGGAPTPRNTTLGPRKPQSDAA